MKGKQTKKKKKKTHGRAARRFSSTSGRSGITTSHSYFSGTFCCVLGSVAGEEDIFIHVFIYLFPHISLSLNFNFFFISPLAFCPRVKKQKKTE